MKARKIWVAEHKDEPGNREVSFSEPRDQYVYIPSRNISGSDDYAEWVEYVIIPVEAD